MPEDNVTNLTRYTTIDRINYKHIAGFEQFIKEKGIGWSFYVDKKTKLIKHRDFTGPEEHRILSTINLSTLLSNYSKAMLDKMEIIWDGFKQLICKLDNLQGDDNKKLLDFSSSAKAWLKIMLVYIPLKMQHRTCTFWHTMFLK